MKDYLYILPFKDKKHFKIGISSNSYSRIIHLDKIYDIDLENSFIVHSKKRNISILEKELLTIFEQDDVDNFLSEGHTEIRNVKYLNECLELIRNKHQNLSYKIEKLNINQNDSQPTKKKPKVEKLRLKEIPPLSYEYFTQSCEKLYNEAYCIERVVYKDSVKYLLKIDGSSFARQCTEFSFYMTNDTDKFSEWFNVGITGMVEDTRNDVSHLTITFPKIVEATHFTWDMLEYEFNDDTKRFFTLFKKTLEQIYFNQEFETEMLFDEIVKQVEYETLNDFYQWDEMENFMKTDETYKEFDKWARAF